MNVIDRLASSLGRKDQAPNLALASNIAKQANYQAIEQLVEALLGQRRVVQNDCIKVLYEIGEIRPELISGHLDTFVTLLSHKNNRLQWGAMTALYVIAPTAQRAVFQNIAPIVAAADAGSVITRDYAVKILTFLASQSKYTKVASKLLVDQLMRSPLNQLPLYAEGAVSIIRDSNKKAILKALRSRLISMESKSKRERLERSIGQITH